LTEKLNSQKAFHGLLGIAIFTVLMLLISFYFAFQIRTNLKTIEAQKQMIQQNAQAITSQINYLNKYGDNHADRNRPIFDRAKQLIDATKQLVSGKTRF
jgi:predicted PurR-regulated permease PerM